MAPVANEFTVIDGGNISENVAKERASFKIWGSEAWANKLRRDVVEMAKQLDTGFMQLAEKLWLIFDTPVDGDPSNSPVWMSWKDKSGNLYTSFEKYVDGELGIHYQKARRLIHTWKVFKIDNQLDDALLRRVVNLGLSKVRELAREGVITQRNVEAWVTKAESGSVLALQTSVSKYLADKATEESARKATIEFEAEYNGSLASTPAEIEKAAVMDEKKIESLEVQSRNFSCILFGDQIETVGLAMKRSMELSGSEKVGNNISLICLDFLATNDFRFESEEQKLRFLAKFERLMGYKLIVADPVTGEVLYGLSTLQKMANAPSED
jgi:hypothetical protein